jgi:adenosylmethionine-8-amino-7-oxononanoate aminotransferase
VNTPSNLIRTFPRNPPLEEVVRTEGHYIYTKERRRFLDATAGGTAYAVLGYNNGRVLDAIRRQLCLYSHLDYKTYADPNREELASLLCSSVPFGLNRVMFSGGSGGEACEMAVQISYQSHCETKNPTKSWYLSRKQSYHGSTSAALSLGERPNLEFYRPILCPSRYRLSDFNYRKNRLSGESIVDYSNRLVTEFEGIVLEIGPENIGGFVAETIMGGLVGDVPASEEYWKGIKALCSRYNIHLIMDEVWCGTGVTGKINCVEWYDIVPEFLILGKTLGAGYIPLSAVMTTSDITKTISENSGRFETSCTFQGHSLACASALEVQRIIREPGFVESVCEKGNYIRNTISDELHGHDFFVEVRGLGVRNSIEYDCPEKHLFGQYVAKLLRENNNILISGKWHRFSLSHAMTFTYAEIDQLLNGLISSFKSVAANWTRATYGSLKPSDFF